MSNSSSRPNWRAAVGLARGDGARAVYLNLAGGAAPVLAALVAFRIVAEKAGTARLGMLGVAWTLLAFLAVADFGFGRFFAKRFAQATSRDELLRERIVLKRFSCAALTMGIVLVPLVIAVLPIAEWLPRGLNARDAASSVVAARLIIGVVPVMLLTRGLRGALEGRLMFGHANLMRGVFGSLSFAAPAVVAYWTVDLRFLVGAAVAVRVFELIAQLFDTRRALPSGMPSVVVPFRWLEMVREGGWFSVSSITGPLLGTLDRLLVARMISAVAVAAYYVPQELGSKVVGFPTAVTIAAYPRLARAVAARDHARYRSLTRQALVLSLAVCLPFCVVFAAMPDAVWNWFDPGFGVDAGRITGILAIGLLCNCVAQVPYISLQALGRVDLVAKLHMVEVPLFVGALTALIPAYGIVGAAVAWAARNVIDCSGLLYLERRVVGVDA